MPDADPRSDDNVDLPGALRLIPAQGGLDCLQINTGSCQAHQYCLGATITHWQPAGHAPVLFTSAKANFRDGVAIRGGVPICFPWFGAHPDDRRAPNHGLVRTRPWQLVHSSSNANGVQLVWVLQQDGWQVEFHTDFGANLSMRLLVTNASANHRVFEAALHTYLRVGDVRQIDITGLESADYLDTVGGGRHWRAAEQQAIRFTSETDRIYQHSTASCTITDPSLGRRIRVDKAGSLSTVVWNPWIARARALADLDDEEWTDFCCVESACIGEHAVSLAPGQSHALSVRLSVDQL